jgi:wyosine [tRNA(Phe)-imidazoG37] synthetase (radical SAM superfamily)
VHGPVPYRRLGRSLGIDPLKTPKTQIFDCIYCQLEGTIEELRRHEDLRFSIGMEKVREDLRRALRSIDPKRLDI